MKTVKGKLFWKYRWFSICSMHGYLGPDENCPRCQTGTWTNVWAWKIGSFIFKLTPKLWILYMNRPNSKARKQIKEWFPKLR